MLRSLLVLGLVACAPSPDPVPVVPGSGAITLLTYNVHGLPDSLTNTERPTAERMARIAPLLDDYDVIGLQEDFDADNHALLVSEATHPGRWWFSATVDEARAYGAGLAVLSRVPSSGYAEEHYLACNGVLDGSSDCLASKGFQVVTLDLGGRQLDVYHTHHEAGRGPDDVAARGEQVEQVLASMDGRSAGRAVLLLGDTNIRVSDPSDEPLLGRYLDAGLREGCDEVGCPEPGHIDRFLLRDGGGLSLTVEAWSREEQFVDEDGADLSDHPAIALTIGWSAD